TGHCPIACRQKIQEHLPAVRVLKNMRILRAGFPLFILGAAVLAVIQPVAAQSPGTQSPGKSSEAPPVAAAKPAGPVMPSVPGSLSAEQIRDLIQKVAENDIENDKKQRNYTFIERDVEHNLDGSGRTKSTETKTYEVLNIYGEQVRRLIEKD